VLAGSVGGTPARDGPVTGESVLLAGGGDLCRRAGAILLSRGHEVWGLRRHPPADDAWGIRWLRGDLTRPETLADLPRAFTHVVYAPAPDARDEALYRAVFGQGLKNLLARLDEAALRRLLFISSSAVYGDHGGAWVNEDTPVAPSGFNGQILAQTEQWLAQARPDAVVLRLAGLYGPGRLQLAGRLKQGAASVPGHDAPWANRMHSEDAARAMAHLLELPRPASCYIGADDTPRRIDALYDAIAAMIGAPAVPRTGPATGEGGKRLDNSRLKTSGFDLAWPDAIEGYRALLAQG